MTIKKGIDKKHCPAVKSCPTETQRMNGRLALRGKKKKKKKKKKKRKNKKS